MGHETHLKSVPADPSKWSARSQRSMSFHYVKEYSDITYNCWRCKKPALFSASDQQHTYEVRKAPIDQRRILCEECWRESLVIGRDIRSCEQQWKESKESLRFDASFLTRWLHLLSSREEFVPYRANIAAKNMLRKLLDQMALETARANEK